MTKKQIKEMDTATFVHYRAMENATSDQLISAWLDDEEAERGNAAKFRNNPELRQVGCCQDY